MRTSEQTLRVQVRCFWANLSHYSSESLRLQKSGRKRNRNVKCDEIYKLLWNYVIILIQRWRGAKRQLLAKGQLLNNYLCNVSFRKVLNLNTFSVWFMKTNVIIVSSVDRWIHFPVGLNDTIGNSNKSLIWNYDCLLKQVMLNRKKWYYS